MKTVDSLQEHQSRVREIIGLSLQFFTNMYQDDVLRFCYTRRHGTTRKPSSSFRYTAIALLGLDRARRCCLRVPFLLDDICTDLAKHASAEVDLGNKALALWAALQLHSEMADKPLEAILNHDGFIANPSEGLIRSTELAWTVYALAMACIDMKTPERGLLNRTNAKRTWQRLEAALRMLQSQRHETTGLFQCASMPKVKGRWRDHLLTTSGFFDSQVYGAMALAQASQVLGKSELLHEAHQTVRTLLRHQGPYGEWPWHYDVLRGTVIEPYPIFSVHQDGMGPMVLLEVGERLGLNFQAAVERSLAWIFGANELRRVMIDREAEAIWRAQRRSGIQQYILQASRIAHHYGLPMVARVLRAAPGRAIEYECRPYHLGWILYAFCRPSQLMPVVNSHHS